MRRQDGGDLRRRSLSVYSSFLILKFSDQMTALDADQSLTCSYFAPRC